MSSWAAIAGAASKPKAAAVPTVPEGVTVVVDANAIISGMQLDRLGDTAVTIPSVLAEIKDAASRQRLATLPLGISTMQPNEESINAGVSGKAFGRGGGTPCCCVCLHFLHCDARRLCTHYMHTPHAHTTVTRFARLTGDIGTLSTVDMHVLALAHMLTIAAHGADALRSQPAPPKTYTKARRNTMALPGWGDEGEEWDVLDALPDVGDAPGMWCCWVVVFDGVMGC